MGTGSSLQSNQESVSPEKGQTNNGIHKQMKKEFGTYGKQNDANGDEKEQTNETNIKNNLSINPAIFKARKLFMKPITNKRPLQQQLVIKKQVSFITF